MKRMEGQMGDRVCEESDQRELRQVASGPNGHDGQRHARREEAGSCVRREMGTVGRVGCDDRRPDTREVLVPVMW